MVSIHLEMIFNVQLRLIWLIWTQYTLTGKGVLNQLTGKIFLLVFYRLTSHKYPSLTLTEARKEGAEWGLVGTYYLNSGLSRKLILDSDLSKP